MSFDRIGLGTTDPRADFHLVGNSIVQGNVTFGLNSVANNPLRVASAGNTPTVYVTQDGTNGIYAARFEATTSSAHGVHIKTAANNGSIHGLLIETPTTSIVVSSNGRIGVGTNAPAESIHVVGNAKITGSLSAGSLTLASVDISDISTSTVTADTIFTNVLSTGTLVATNISIPVFSTSTISASSISTGQLNVGGSQITSTNTSYTVLGTDSADTAQNTKIVLHGINEPVLGKSGSIDLIAAASSSGGDISFMFQPSVGSSVTNMVIGKDGRVGIGTNVVSVGTRMAVMGNAVISGAFTVSGATAFGSTLSVNGMVHANNISVASLVKTTTLSASTISSATIFVNNLSVASSITVGVMSVSGTIRASSISLAADATVVGLVTVGNGLRLTQSGGVNYIQSGANLTSGSAADLFIGNMQQTTTASSRKIIIKADGKVGIGTNAPAAALHVNVLASSTGSATTPQTALDLTWTETSDQNLGEGEGTKILLSNVLSTGIKYEGAYVASYKENGNDTDTSTSLVFGTRATADTGVLARERMRITSTGNISIAGSNLTIGNLALGSNLTLPAENLSVLANGIDPGWISGSYSFNITKEVAITRPGTIAQFFNLPDSNHTEGRRIYTMVRVTDAEGGVVINVNDTDVKTIHYNQMTAGTAGNDNSIIWSQIDITDYVIVGASPNTIRIYSNSADGFTLSDIVTFCASHYLKSGEPFIHDILFKRNIDVAGSITVAGSINATGSINAGSVSYTSLNAGSLSAATNVSVGVTTTPTLFVNTTSGNVGINTGTPTQKLEVIGSARISQNLSAAVLSAPSIFAGNLSVSSNVIINNSLSVVGNVNIRNGVLVIPNSGNVGIGSATPSVKLDVIGDTKVSGYLSAANMFTTGNVSIASNMIARGNLTVGTNPTLFVNTTSGNVGIGIASPITTLDVAGNARITGTISVTTLVVTNFVALAAVSYPTVTATSLMSAATVQAGNLSVTSNVNVAGNMVVSGNAAFDNNTLFVNGAAGRVGVGTTSPLATLDIVAPDTEVALLNIRGSGSQGTGKLFLGQSNTFGGGIIYNGDNVPVDVGASDDITFYRRDGGTDTGVFSYRYDSNTVKFAGDISLTGFSNTSTSGADIAVIRGRGTAAAPTGVQTDDVIGGIYAKAYNSSGVSSANNIAAIRIMASQPHTTSAAGTKIDFATTSNGSISRDVRMTISDNGYVGIGSNPGTQGKLAVFGGEYRRSNTWNVGSVEADDPGNGTPSNSTFTNTNVSRTIGIYTDSAVYAVKGYGHASDIRIKREIEPVSDGEALISLRNIEPHKYCYIDQQNGNNTKVIGFIAQQVAQHLSEAVFTKQEVIPDIYQACVVDISTRTIKLPVKARSGKMRVVTKIGRAIDFLVKSDDEDTVQFSYGDITTDDLYEGKIFVYGYEVDDFHALNKDYLFTINFAATQELDRKITRLESENAELKAKLDLVMARLNM